MRGDAYAPLLSSWEDPVDGEWEPAALFDRRTVRPVPKRRTAADAAEALAMSLNAVGRVDMGYMESVSGLAPEAIRAGLSGRVYYCLLYTSPLCQAVLDGHLRNLARVAAAHRLVPPRRGPLDKGQDVRVDPLGLVLGVYPGAGVVRPLPGDDHVDRLLCLELVLREDVYKRQGTCSCRTSPS